MRRTTLRLDDDLLRRLKEKAARDGTTLQALDRESLFEAMEDR
jgi:predicted DNA binding CopG/RHH family protein